MAFGLWQVKVKLNATHLLKSPSPILQLCENTVLFDSLQQAFVWPGAMFGLFWKLRTGWVTLFPPGKQAMVGSRVVVEGMQWTITWGPPHRGARDTAKEPARAKGDCGSLSSPIVGASIQLSCFEIPIVPEGYGNIGHAEGTPLCLFQAEICIWKLKDLKISSNSNSDCQAGWEGGHCIPGHSITGIGSSSSRTYMSTSEIWSVKLSLYSFLSGHSWT